MSKRAGSPFSQRKTLMKRFLMLVLAGLVLVAALPAAAQDANTPRFEPSDCAFTPPPGQEPQCGYLVVPEDRSNPNGNTIQVAVAVFKSTNPNPSDDAMIYLDGGPGGSTLANISLSFDSLFAPYLAERDVIAFDQRGVGLSQPALDCPELTDMTYDLLDQHVVVDESVRLGAEAISACGARLRGEGINLAAYNSVESAADVNDLREVLGYDQLDLLGISYGTRLALTIMRDFPQAVRSSIIDSVVPLQRDKFEDVMSADHAFNTLFDACANDAACNEAFPNLKTVFYDTAAQLDANPTTVSVPDLRTPGQSIDAVVDGTVFVSLNFQAMYIQDLLGTLPEAIYAAKDGDLSTYAPIFFLQLYQLSQISEGMFYAVNCNEEFAFDTVEDIQAILAAAPPELVNFARNSLIDPAQLTVCANLGAGTPDPKENEAVVSDIPTLVLSGEFDPITPPIFGEEAAKTLSNSYVYQFPGLSHGVSPSNACTQGITADFFNDPNVAPDTSCIASLPQIAFETPNSTTASVETADVTLVPFSDEQFGFTGLKPEGWNEIQIGTVARGEGFNDQTALIQLAAPMVPPDQLVSLLAGQFGLQEDPESSGTREANGLTWVLYHFDVMGYPSDLALAESRGTTYMIQMTSSKEERDSLFEKVFLPVVDGLVPIA
jgi:pimeloyl-ACP methyl ester carboxylesterase